MSKTEDKTISFILEALRKMSGGEDPEDLLFSGAKLMLKRFNCVETIVYIVDKDKKNGYVIVNGKHSDQKNIPFTVKARPELVAYFAPKQQTVLKELKGFGPGVYRFEEFTKVLAPIDEAKACLLFCELANPEEREVRTVKKVAAILGLVMRSIVGKTEIFKLLYGTTGEGASDVGTRDETLAELAGSVAHLLNQPLTSLMGYAELLIRTGKFKKDELVSLNKIYNEAERLADIIRKIESVTSYVTEDYVGSAKILKLDDLSAIGALPGGVKKQAKEKRVSKKLEIFLEFYKSVSQSKNRGEILHNYAFSINRMFPNLNLLLLTYKKEREEFYLEYKEKGGYSRDFELSESRLKFYRKILDDGQLKIYRFGDDLPHIITIPLVIGEEKIGIAEYDFEKEEISMFDLILLESMVEELVLALHRIKLAEKNRYLKDYIANLIENTSSLIFVVDESHTIRTCNPSFEEAIKLGKVDMEKRKFVEFVADSGEKEMTTRAIQECFSGKVIKKLDLKILDANSNKLDTRFSLIPLPKVKNLRPEIIMIGQNITEAKQLENQIMQSEKLAYLGQIAASVAHELNNPLTHITVYTEYLQKRLKQDFPDRYEMFKDKVDRIFESANRIHSFTRNLTSFAQPSDSSVPEPIDINNVIRESILFSDYEIDKEKVEVVCNFDENLPPIEGVKSQLHQVFINLIANAAHALNDSAGKIVMSTADHDENFVKVVVRDNGSGVDPKILDKIFEPFVSTRKEEGGSGLGLSIARKIIDNHKGRIEVESEAGKGTSFSLFLPKRV